MHSEAEIEDYKLKVELLQEKLQKSEENRQQLEQQLNIILQKHDDRKRYFYKQSRRRYEQFLDDQKKHSERNKRLLQMLDGINQEATALAARTERLKKLKLQYEMYVANFMQSQAVGCMSSSTSDINGSMKSIPILVPTSFTENMPDAKSAIEELSKNLNGNMGLSAELTSCQFRFAMATPLPAGMLLMPTSSINSTSVKGQNCLNTKNNAESIPKKTSQDDVNNVENEKLVTRIPEAADDTTAGLLKNTYNIEQTINDKMQENKPKNVEPTAEDQNNVEEDASPNNNLEQLVYENYKIPLSPQPEKKILNYSYAQENISKPTAELPEEVQYMQNIENLETKMDEMQIKTEAAVQEDKTNIENIENAIYGELVEPIENNLYLNSEVTVFDNDGKNPLVTNYATNDNFLEGKPYESNFNVAEMVSNAGEGEEGEFNYEPTLVTTEAELYSQSTLEQNKDFENDDNNQQIQNEQEYENVDYANYEQYENVENVYDNNTVYPGYTFDAATGQYLSNETELPVVADNAVNYEEENVVYNETLKPLGAYDESNYSENIENSTADILAGGNIETPVPVEANNNESQLQGKSVKPILSTPSSSALTTGSGSASNEGQKKKKRVNFLDNKNGDESSDTNANTTELSTGGNSSSAKTEKKKV